MGKIAPNFRFKNMSTVHLQSDSLSSPGESTDRRIGLIAGWGNFPVRVAQTLKSDGYQVYCMGIKDHADPRLAGICDDYREFGIGRMGAQIRYLKSYGVVHATLAGKVFKTRFFERFSVIRHFPDLTFWRHFYPVFLTKSVDRKDDTLLLTVTQVYAAGGIEFLPATDYAPELLVKQGTLTNRKPTEAQWKDIRFGWTAAKEMGRLDIGQSVIVKDRAVLAVEAIEGTDACIQRSGDLCKSGGMTLVKVAKPNQDMRFDVPTIGEGTVETLHKSGGKVIAIEAGKTIVLDQEATIATANRLGIAIVAIDASEIEE